MKLDFKNNMDMVIQGGIVIVLLITNIIGVVYCYGIFTSITTTNDQMAATIPSELIPPLNNTLYDQIVKDRQTRYMYTSSSSAPSFSVNEIFGSN